MSRRGTWSRVSELLRQPGSGPQKRTRAKQGAVVGAATMIVLAPLAAGAPSQLDASRSELPRPVGPVTVAGPSTAATASLPWVDAARRGSGLTAIFAGLTATAPTGIPAPVAAAYRSAEAALARTQAGCHLPWWVLAGIGHVESGHAGGGRIDATGRTLGEIYGPVLDGSTTGTAVVADTDQGAVDGDATYDRAVGPMQFLPSTWRSFGADGDGDGKADPHDIDDAALSAGGYLCSGGDDLRDAAALRTAILRYNPSEVYVHDVLAAGEAYRDGRTPPPAWIPPVGPGTASPGSRTAPVIAAAPVRGASTAAADTPRRSAAVTRAGAVASATTPGRPAPLSAAPTSTPSPSAPSQPTTRPTGSPTGATTGGPIAPVPTTGSPTTGSPPPAGRPRPTTPPPCTPEPSATIPTPTTEPSGSVTPSVPPTPVPASTAPAPSPTTTPGGAATSGTPGTPGTPQPGAAGADGRTPTTLPCTAAPTGGLPSPTTTPGIPASTTPVVPITTPPAESAR